MKSKLTVEELGEFDEIMKTVEEFDCDMREACLFVFGIKIIDLHNVESELEKAEAATREAKSLTSRLDQCRV